MIINITYFAAMWIMYDKNNSNKILDEVKNPWNTNYTMDF
jgi:hypothetical protein